MSDTATITTRLVATVHAWADAIVTNDPTEIDRYMTPDWVLVTPETGIVAREHFLDVVGTGRLRHDTMSHEVLRLRMYAGDTIAVVTTRGRNTGSFDGTPLDADEWTTDVFERHHDAWRCVLTQLTPVDQAATNPGGSDD